MLAVATGWGVLRSAAGLAGQRAEAVAAAVLAFRVASQVVWSHGPYWSRPHLSGHMVM